MKFKFSLEKLLQHRRHLEDMAKKDYLEVLGKLEEEKTKLKNYYEAISGSRNYAHSLEDRGGQQAEGLVQSHIFVKGTEIKIESQKKIIEKCQIIVEEKLEILRQASIESKMMERLKENKKEEFKKVKNKSEQKFLDEMATLRYKGLK